MFSDYKEAVLRDFQEKKAEGRLSLNLIKPTPGSIKKEWLMVFETRRKKDDIKILRLFFGEKENDEAYEWAIRKMEVDKFRPLCNFIKNQTVNPEDRTVELLAWLIDYPARPFQFGLPVSEPLMKAPDGLPPLGGLQSLSNADAGTIYGGNNYHLIQSVAPRVRWVNLPPGLQPYRQSIIIGILVMAAGLLGFSLTNSSESPSILSIFRSKPCMYWSGDHYIPVECDLKIPSAEVMALDEFKAEHFRKITRPDTLRESDITKVYYLKSNNMIEIFTMDGKHPEQGHKDLRPLTKYMYDKYVVGKKVRVD